MNHRGMTLVEVLIGATIVVLVARFGGDIFSLNTSVQANLMAQLEGRQVLRTLVTELRSASPSSTGSFPLQEVGTSSLIFYSNIDQDTAKERIRYFRVGDELRRGEINPSGNPLVYATSSESIRTVIRDIRNGTSTALFTYYNALYMGTSTPLAQPVDPSQVRLIRTFIIIDRDPLRSPTPIIIETNAMIRNLKDNL